MIASPRTQTPLPVGLDTETSRILDRLVADNPGSTREAVLEWLIDSFDTSVVALDLASSPPDAGVTIALPQQKVVEHAQRLADAYSTREGPGRRVVSLGTIWRAMAEHQLRSIKDDQKVVAIAGVPVSA